MALRKEELATIRGQMVWIHNWEKLAEIADFESDYLQVDVKPEQRMRIAEVC
jgi:hypothetical protein